MKWSFDTYVLRVHNRKTMMNLFIRRLFEGSVMLFYVLLHVSAMDGWMTGWIRRRKKKYCNIYPFLLPSMLSIAIFFFLLFNFENSFTSHTIFIIVWYIKFSRRHDDNKLKIKNTFKFEQFKWALGERGSQKYSFNLI